MVFADCPYLPLCGADFCLGTVITSLPNTHKSSERYNIRKLLSEEIETNKKRRAIQAPENLVSAVLKICLSIMTREGPSGVKLQECFQSSINTIVRNLFLCPWITANSDISQG